MCPIPTGEKYILMVRDDHFGYSWLYIADYLWETIHHAIVHWCAAYGFSKQSLSDKPIYFKNMTLRTVPKDLQTPQQYTFSYRRSTNKAIEWLEKELLCEGTTVLFELQKCLKDWPQLVSLMQSSMNNASSPEHNNAALYGCLRGPPAVATHLLLSHDFDSRSVLISKAQWERTIDSKDLIRAIDEIHPLVQNCYYKVCQRMCTANKKENWPIS